MQKKTVALSPRRAQRGSTALPLVAATALALGFGCSSGDEPAQGQLPAFPAASSGSGAPAAEQPAPSDEGAEATAPEGDRVDEGAGDAPVELVPAETPAPAGGASPGEAPAAEAPAVEPQPAVEVPPTVEPAPATNTFVENTGADCQIVAPPAQNNANLPDPFARNDGTRISTAAEWRCRRAEIKRDLEQFEIGPKPDRPTVEATFAGGRLSVNVSTAAGSLTLASNVTVPQGDGPHCVAIGMNNESSLINGCVQVPFLHDQVVTYAQNSNRSQNDPFYRLYPELFNQVGNYAAWSWGISRIIDGLEQVKDQVNVDLSRIGVHGCSYAGKMALFGGALDERVALTVVQESGGGGINSWRVSQEFTNRTGVQVEKIDNTNYSWFKGSMQALNPNSLPHDHHELIAMIAPRAVIALGNPPFEWLGDESGFKSIMAAREVWSAMGLTDRIGMDFTGGHNHCAAAPSQVTSVNAFVNKFLKGQDANTNVMIQPQQAGFDLNVQSKINWTTPTLQ